MAKTGTKKFSGGILPVDKPVGMTSHDVVDRARKILGVRKVGHTGTLDPQASGLLLLCVGGATRFAEYLTNQNKKYRAVIELGVSTSTDDIEGQVLFKYGGDLETLVTEERLKSALVSFTGTVQQVPPDYCSKKVDGVPAYVLARQGKKPDLKPVTVWIDSISLLSFELPRVEIELGCSAGTYLRSLARDLGAQLGCGGHLASLVRTAIGDFTLEKAFTLDLLENAGAQKVGRSLLVPVEKALAMMPALILSDKACEKIYFGQSVDLEGGEALQGEFPQESCKARIYDRENRFLGIGLISPLGANTGTLSPKRLMVEAFRSSEEATDPPNSAGLTAEAKGCTRGLTERKLI